jgi:hypothetical protein
MRLYFCIFLLGLLTLVFGSQLTSCPTRIKTVIPGRGKMATMADVHSVMKTCPDITSLNLRITLLGCSEWPDRWNFPFNQFGGERYPAKLRYLSLEGYEFNGSDYDNIQPPKFESHARQSSDVVRCFSDFMNWLTSAKFWKWLEWRNLPAEQQSKRNIDLWIDAMDFSKIKTLSLAGWKVPFEILKERLGPILQSVEDLTVTGKRAKGFILSLQPNTLTDLAWTWTDPYSSSLAEVLSHHGQSLTTLEWRTPEMDVETRPVMSPPEIRELARLAPNLNTLNIDLNRNGTWPYEELGAISSSMLKLRRLTLYLEVASECRRQRQDTTGRRCTRNCDGLDQFAKPFLNKAEALKLFNLLRNKKVGEPFEFVRFKVGDWSRLWDGPIYMPPWIENRRGEFECRVARATREVICEGSEADTSFDPCYGGDTYEHELSNIIEAGGNHDVGSEDLLTEL